MSKHSPTKPLLAAAFLVTLQRNPPPVPFNPAQVMQELRRPLPPRRRPLFHPKAMVLAPSNQWLEAKLQKLRPYLMSLPGGRWQ